LITAVPSVSGTWYPQVVYKKLRDNAPTRPFTAKSLFNRPQFG
jgi:hypothetical protein